MLLCVHTRYNLFAHSSCTSLFILIFIKSTVDCIAHFSSLHMLLLNLFYFIFYLFFILFLPIFIYTLLCYVSYFILFFCTVHWADPSWPTFHYWLYPVWLRMWQINKNLEPWTLNEEAALQSNRHTCFTLMTQTQNQETGITWFQGKRNWSVVELLCVCVSVFT